MRSDKDGDTLEHDTGTAPSQETDLGGADYWETSRPVRHNPGAVRHAVHRVLGRKVTRMLSSALEEVPGNATVLEIGCSPGWTLAKIGKIRPDLRLHGIDYAPSSAEQTLALLAEESVSAQIFRADMREYRPSAPFDVVLSAGLVEHYSDPSEPLVHHARLAKPGGSVVVTVPDLRTPLVRLVARWLAPEDFATHNTEIMAPQALERAMSEAGLEQVTVTRAGGAMLFIPRRGKSGIVGRVYTVVAYAWNLVAAILPEALSPWHAHIVATARPSATSGSNESEPRTD